MTKQAEKRVYKTSGLGIACGGISFFGGRRQDADLHKSTQGCGIRSKTMKKLMIAATAALCAAVGFSDGIESSNVVGYSESTIQSGYTLVTPQFCNVNAEGKIALDSIIPVGTFDSDEITINLLDEFGSVVRGWTWINWGGDSGDLECWSEDGAGEKAEGVEFDVGQAFWVQGASSEQGLRSSGQVGRNDTTFQLMGGYTITGNPFPVALNLTDILPSGDVQSDDITINTLDEYGSVIRGWTWINWGGDSGDVECWSEDGSGEVTEGVTFAPGQGLWVQAGSDAEYLTFPAPEF